MNESNIIPSKLLYEKGERNIEIKKVKKIDNEVTAEFYIEDTSECGHIVIDINIMDIKEYSMPSGWETDFIYLAHARDSIIRMIKENDIVEERLVMWY